MNNYDGWREKLKAESVIALTEKLNAANQKIVELQRSKSNLRLSIETLNGRIEARAKEELRIDHIKAAGIEWALEKVKPSSQFTVERFKAIIDELRGEG